ncbi:MAG: NUDIX domain-containing protein [Candidatus Roizmanbacteria bacterium]|nr:NUDIX domain-containing protein [Candidatus Roizmanbacteria bacterium]
MNIKKEISAGGIVFRTIHNSENGDRIEWLTTQHSQHKGWVFPKGLVGDTNSNEKMEDAALREVEEEGGVKAKIVNPVPVKVFYSYTWNDMQIDKTVFYYLMEYISGDPKNHDWEMMDAKFMTASEVISILSYPSDRQAFDTILKENKL